MNKLFFSIAMLNFTIACAHADQPATSLKPIAVRDGHLVVDCRAQWLPSRQAVGEVLETNNASRIYAERERLIHIAHRECMRGASYVAFVHDTSAPASTLAMVQP